MFAVAALAIITVFIILFFLKGKRLHFIFAALLLFTLIIATLVNMSVANRLSYLDGKNERITAVITQPTTEHGTGYSYTARLETVGESRVNLANIKVNMYEDALKPGDLITARVDLYEHDNKNSFYADNIYIHCNVEKIISVESQHSRLRYKIFRLQKYTKDTVSGYLDGDIGQLIIAVITGDRSGISDETYSLVKKSGVAHMIVVSGMHLSIICSAVMWLLRRTLPNRFAQCGAMLLITFFIILFCGFTKSVLRAGITYTILSLAPLLKRDRDSLSALSLTVIVVLHISPFAFYSISFLLTLSATFGILVLAPFLSERLNKVLHTDKVNLLKNTVDIICVTVAANIMTLPIVLYVYEWVSTVSLLTNILINYAVSALLVLGIVAVLIGKMDFIAYPCFFITGLLSEYALWVIKTLGSLPFATVNFSGKAMAVVVCMLYLIIFLYFKLLKRNN